MAPRVVIEVEVEPWGGGLAARDEHKPDGGSGRPDLRIPLSLLKNLYVDAYASDVLVVP